MATVGFLLPTGCAVFDAFAPTGAAKEVAWSYVGPTCMLVADRMPFQVTLLVKGVPVPQVMQEMLVTPDTVLAVTPAGDSLVALNAGIATVAVRVVHSTIGADAPDTAITVRVRTGSCGGPL